MKYLAMFLEIFGEALFLLIGCCVVIAVFGFIIYSAISICDGIERSGNYVNNLTRKTFKKYSFTPGKSYVKDKWENLV